MLELVFGAPWYSIWGESSLWAGIWGAMVHYGVKVVFGLGFEDNGTLQGVKGVLGLVFGVP